MSRPRGGYIGFNRAPASGALNSAASGVWTLREVEALRRAGTWPGQFVNPLSIAGLQLWLDASDSATLFDATSGGSLVAADGGVARWEDKSGNGRHFTQATSGNRPARKVADINGLDCLRFDGSNDILTRSQETWAHTVPLNFFVVFRAAAFTPAYHAIWDFYGLDADFMAGNTGMIKSNGKSSIYLTAVNSSQPNYDGTGSVTYAINTTHVFFASIDNNVISSRGNKASDGSHTGSWTNRTNLGSDPLKLGASSLFNRYTDIKICEFIVYNAALSSTERDAVEDYLTGKWKP
jgi:hypothetical protein